MRIKEHCKYLKNVMQRSGGQRSASLNPELLHHSLLLMSVFTTSDPADFHCTFIHFLIQEPLPNPQQETFSKGIGLENLNDNW